MRDKKISEVFITKSKINTSFKEALKLKRRVKKSFGTTPNTLSIIKKSFRSKFPSYRTIESNEKSLLKQCSQRNITIGIVASKECWAELGYYIKKDQKDLYLKFEESSKKVYKKSYYTLYQVYRTPNKVSKNIATTPKNINSQILENKIKKLLVKYNIKLSPEFNDFAMSCYGYSLIEEKSIHLNPFLNELEIDRCTTLIHELTHILLNHIQTSKIPEKVKNRHEVEAELVSYLVCSYYKLDETALNEMREYIKDCSESFSKLPNISRERIYKITNILINELQD